MADRMEVHVRQARREQGWSQDALARRSGVSRAEISAVETGRVVPSTAVALALAAALRRPVEDLFRLGGALPVAWAWEPLRDDARFWTAEAFGRRLRYPAEDTARGTLPHDGRGAEPVPRRGHGRGAAGPATAPPDPAATLVVAGCDPAAGILAEALAAVGVRMLPFVRSSGRALDLLAERRVHAAGVHLGETSDENRRLVRARLGEGYALLPVATWTEGVALAPGTGIRSVRGVLGRRLRWVGREEGSGARRCMDELLEGRDPPAGVGHTARDHRGVVESIRAGWAQAGVCVELSAEDGGLAFLPVRTEAYDLCIPEALAGDSRIRALEDAVRSRAFRALLGDLPGYRPA